MTVQTQFIAGLAETYTGILNAMSVYTYPASLHSVKTAQGPIQNIRYSAQRDDTHHDCLGFHVTHLTWPSGDLVSPLFDVNHPFYKTRFANAFRAAQQEIDIASGRLQEMRKQKKEDEEIAKEALALTKVGAPLGIWIQSAVMLSGMERKNIHALQRVFALLRKRFTSDALYIDPLIWQIQLILQMKIDERFGWADDLHELASSWVALLKTNDKTDPIANELILYAGLGYCIGNLLCFQEAAELWKISGERKNQPEDLLRAAWAHMQSFLVKTRLRSVEAPETMLKEAERLITRALEYPNQPKKDELREIAGKLNEAPSVPA